MSFPDEPSETIEATCPECRTTSRYPAVKKGMMAECAICSAQVGVGIPTATMVKPPSVPTIQLEPASKTARLPKPPLPKAKSPVAGIVAGLAGFGILGGAAAGVYFATLPTPESTAPVDSNDDKVAVNVPKRNELPDEPNAGKKSLPPEAVPTLPEKEETKKSLVAAPTIVKDFKDAGKVAPKTPEKNYVPVPPPPPPPPPLKVPEPAVKETPKPTPAPVPAKTPETPPKQAAPTVVKVPTLIPRPGATIAAGTNRDTEALLDYEVSADTLKGKALVERGQIILVEVTTEVSVEGQSADKAFTYVRPTEGKHKGKFLIVRASKVTMPKK